jgi:hypothetical protein
MRSLSWIALGLVLACAPLAAAEKATLANAAATIKSAEAKKHVDTLADDQFEGREAGSRGGKAAAGYVVSELQKLDVKPLGDDKTFYQSYAGGRNILALVEGSDPELKKQYVVVGAHYDHVGYGNRTNSYGPFGFVHNGADDNASGVSGLLEVVQAVTSLPERPKRSILFAFWDGEEKGLLGSQHWVSRPTVPLKSVALYVNLDMIGRLRKSRVEVYGTRTSYALRELVSRANEETSLVLDFTWEMKENSDHYTFYQQNIPSMMFHTGLHDNYHRPSDDTHLINNDGIEQVSRLVFNFVVDIADSDRSFRFRQQSRSEDPAGKRAFEQPLASPGPRFGLEWRDAKEDEKGVVVTKITAGLPAAKAGLRPGDRIVKFNGQEVTSELPLRMAVLAAVSPVELEILRGDMPEPTKLLVHLLGSPTRLGIAWRDDSAEPGSVMLTQVVPGSAAYAAGLKERDRICEVGGQRFHGSKEFRELATTLPSPLEVQVERAGRLYKLTLELPK